jgi:hypothetical protein
LTCARCTPGRAGDLGAAFQRRQPVSSILMGDSWGTSEPPYNLCLRYFQCSRGTSEPPAQSGPCAAPVRPCVARVAGRLSLSGVPPGGRRDSLPRPPLRPGPRPAARSRRASGAAGRGGYRSARADRSRRAGVLKLLPREGPGRLAVVARRTGRGDSEPSGRIAPVAWRGACPAGRPASPDAKHLRPVGRPPRVGRVTSVWAVSCARGSLSFPIVARLSSQ